MIHVARLLRILPSLFVGLACATPSSLLATDIKVKGFDKELWENWGITATH